jgi:hypothetical protein
MAGEMLIQGMQPDEVFNKITATGVSASDAAVIVGDWLAQQQGGTQRVFDYSTAFPASEADCVAHFARSFHHVDWLDGESVVQAGQTVGEDGFNVRLHHIEADLDAIGDDVRTAFTCLATMRASLADVLAEIKAELNRLNADVARLANDRIGPFPVGQPGRVGQVIASGNFLGAAKFFDQNVLVWQTEQGLMMLPGIAPVDGNPVQNPRIDRAVALAKLLASRQDIQTAVRAGITKEQLVTQFGTASLPGDPALSDLVDILPAGERFTDPEALSNEVTQREAAAARTSGLADAVVASNFAALGPQPTNLAQAPIDSTTSIPNATRAGLVAAGIGTVGALAQATPAQLQQNLAAHGVTIDAPTAAGLVTQAKALTMIR